MNFLDVEIRLKDGKPGWIAYAGGRLAELPDSLDPACRQVLLAPLKAGIRPHCIEVSNTRMRATDLSAEVGAYESLGERGVLTVRL